LTAAAEVIEPHTPCAAQLRGRTLRVDRLGAPE